MVIDPIEPFALVELERIKWFLGQLDLTKNDDAGLAIQDAHVAVCEVIRQFRKGSK